ncbi:Kex1p, partial [Reticulomyxa filosa]
KAYQNIDNVIDDMSSLLSSHESAKSSSGTLSRLHCDPKMASRTVEDQMYRTGFLFLLYCMGNEHLSNDNKAKSPQQQQQQQQQQRQSSKGSHRLNKPDNNNNNDDDDDDNENNEKGDDSDSDSDSEDGNGKKQKAAQSTAKSQPAAKADDWLAKLIEANGHKIYQLLQSKVLLLFLCARLF